MINSRQDKIVFERLPKVAAQEIIDHMSDPRVAEHMPLLKGEWDQEACAKFVAAKEQCWQRDGLGHWAIIYEGAYTGWGGFQKEGDEWDFGLVLKPSYFGIGMRVTRKALAFAKADQRIPFVTFLLAPSRRNLSALERMGARFVEQLDYEGHPFLKYRLETI